MKIKSLTHYAKGTLKFLIRRYTVNQLLKEIKYSVSAICRTFHPPLRALFIIPSQY